MHSVLLIVFGKTCVSFRRDAVDGVFSVSFDLFSWTIFVTRNVYEQHTDWPRGAFTGRLGGGSFLEVILSGETKRL